MAESLKIIVKAKGDHRRIAVVDKGKLVEFYAEDTDETTLVNAVILGRVENVAAGVKAAFVNIGQPQNGFLPLAEMESFQKQEAEKPLISGEDVIVQVKKDAKGEKGAFLTRDIALPGQTVIYMPLNRYVGVSKRVTDDTEREKLTEMGRRVAADKYGLIMRYAALLATEDEVKDEITALKALWENLQGKAIYQKAPAVLYKDPSALTSLVRDYAPRYQMGITCGDAVNRMPSPPNGLMWEQLSEIELDSVWRATRIDEQLHTALSRTVPLKNGGTLVIDEREALSTVDVNSAKYIGEKDGNLALEQNLMSCTEIARQIRLRNLSGIVLVDFIDMRSDEDRKAVTDQLETEMSRDRTKTVVHGFTRLGLLEITRKRSGASLRDMVEMPCKTCGGTGYRLQREKE